MRDVTLDELLLLAEVAIHDLLIDQGQPELGAVYHLVAPLGKHDLIVQCLWNNDQEKAAVVADVRQRAQALGAIAVLFMTEAWAVHRPLAWTPGPHDDPPAEHPERQEIVIAVASDGLRTEMRSWSMVRNQAGELTELIELPPSRSDDRSALRSEMTDGMVPPPKGRVH